MGIHFKDYKGSYFLIFSIVITFVCDNLFLNGNLYKVLSAKSFDTMTSAEYYKFFTAFLVHTNLLIFIANSIALFCLGRYLEKVIGSRNFILIFFIANTLVFFIASIIYEGNYVMYGSSPGIYALTTILFISAFKHNDLIHFNFVSFTGSFIVTYFLICNIINLESFLLHLGGMLIGIVLLYFHKNHILTHFCNNTPI